MDDERMVNPPQQRNIYKTIRNFIDENCEALYQYNHQTENVRWCHLGTSSPQYKYSINIPLCPSGPDWVLISFPLIRQTLTILWFLLYYCFIIIYFYVRYPLKLLRRCIDAVIIQEDFWVNKSLWVSEKYLTYFSTAEM